MILRHSALFPKELAVKVNILQWTLYFSDRSLKRTTQITFSLFTTIFQANQLNKTEVSHIGKQISLDLP